MQSITKIFSALTILACSVSVHASVLLGGDNNLHAIDTTDGSSVVVDSLDSAYRLGLAYNSLTETMYSIGLFDGVLSTVDLTTYDTAAVGPSNGYGMTGLTFSGDYSVLYSISGNGGNILEVDPTTGAATVIGGGGSSILDLATSSDGTVYASGTNEIFTVDLNTGLLTSIGASNFFTAIAFDENDVLYGIDIFSDALYTVDVSNGVSTLVGGDIGSDVRGMAFVIDASVPVPAPLALLGIGMLAIGCTRRKKVV